MRVHNSVTICCATRSSLVVRSLYSALVVLNGPGAVASGAVWPNETVVAASMTVSRAIAYFVFCIGYSREAGYFYFGKIQDPGQRLPQALFSSRTGVRPS